MLSLGRRNPKFPNAVKIHPSQLLNGGHKQTLHPHSRGFITCWTHLVLSFSFIHSFPSFVKLEKKKRWRRMSWLLAPLNWGVFSKRSPVIRDMQRMHTKCDCRICFPLKKAEEAALGMGGGIELLECSGFPCLHPHRARPPGAAVDRAAAAQPPRGSYADLPLGLGCGRSPGDTAAECRDGQEHLLAEATSGLRILPPRPRFHGSSSYLVRMCARSTS